MNTRQNLILTLDTGHPIEIARETLKYLRTHSQAPRKGTPYLSTTLISAPEHHFTPQNASTVILAQSRPL